MAGVILGLGSNEGNRAANLRIALVALHRSPELCVRRVSPLYESDAMLEAGAPPEWNQPFLNLAVECGWRGERPPAEKLLTSVKAIEEQLGRKARARWAPRVIDIDILDWDGGPVAFQGLRIPHIGLSARPFALLPFTDLRGPSSFSELALRWRSGEDVPFRSRRASRALTGLVGVLNLTPDSFSDGGRYADPARALAQARALLAAGAEALDLGSESTRPGASPITLEEESQRLLPTLELLRRELPSEVLLSVDTRRAEIARQALERGADWINDVTGFEDPAMIVAVRPSACRLVAMHSLSIPPSREARIPKGRDPVEYLLEWGQRKLSSLERAGIARERVVLDPGIGFGTSSAQSWQILGSAERFHELGCEILFGHSRKSFLGDVTARPAADRDLETATLSVGLTGKGIEWLRVHDVESSMRALRGWMAMDGVACWDVR